VRRRRTDARVLGGFWRGLEKPTGRSSSGEEERNASALGVVSSTSLSFGFLCVYCGRCLFMWDPLPVTLRLVFSGDRRNQNPFYLFDKSRGGDGRSDGPF